jgi:nuclear cap-binding protein subunit 1
LVLNLLRGRADANDVISHLESLGNSLEVSDEDTTVDALVRSIAVQSLLQIGARSFSHLLNAIERYLPLLRNLASGGAASIPSGSGDAEAKRDILTAVAMFWKRSRNMVSIVFDKLMQYQIVDPNDVVGWTFENGGVAGRDEASRLNAFRWDLVKAALDKANGRVMIAKKKVKVLRKEEDDTRAKVRAGGADNSMEVDVDAKEGFVSLFLCPSQDTVY